MNRRVENLVGIAGFVLGAGAVWWGIGLEHAARVLPGPGPDRRTAVADPSGDRPEAAVETEPVSPRPVEVAGGSVGTSGQAVAAVPASLAEGGGTKVPPSVSVVLDETGQSEEDYFAYQTALTRLEAVRAESAGCSLFNGLETDVRGRVEHFYSGQIAPRVPAGRGSQARTEAAVQRLGAFHARALDLFRKQPPPSTDTGYRDRARMLDAWRVEFTQIAAELDVEERATELELQRILGAPRAPFSSYLRAR